MEVKVRLRNPLKKSDKLDYYIVPNGTQLSRDWIQALKGLLQAGNPIEKSFCFLGFPKTQRTLEYLCDELNEHIITINKFDFTEHGLEDYVIEEWFHPNVVRFGKEYPIETRVITVSEEEHNSRKLDIGLHPKHDVMNRLHNHFERLQGTVDQLSEYYRVADYETKYAIRQLNNLCHEMENLILSQRKAEVAPEWVRPSQITTFLQAKRLQLTDEHRQGFLTNGYDRRFGHVYMHWTQIGKTLHEVFRDEGAPELTETVCEEITHLEYYSGEFDIEWAKDVTMSNNYEWHNKTMLEFDNWLLKNGLDPKDPKLSLGYLELGHVDLLRSFGTSNMIDIHQQLSHHLDIYAIEVDGVSQTFDYVWSDSTYAQREIETMQSGYDFTSRG